MKEYWEYFIKNIKLVINDLKSKDKEKRRKHLKKKLKNTHHPRNEKSTYPQFYQAHITIFS